MKLSRVLLVIGVIVGLLVLAAAGAAAYVFVAGGSGEISATISAPTLDLNQIPNRRATATAAAPTATPTGEATEAAVEGTVFEIVSAESQAQFTIDEILRGEPFTVVGTTDQVAGQIFVSFSNPADSLVGAIRINARSLQTDSGNRDRAIRGVVLESARDEYEFINFAPTALEGLPASVETGQPVSFQIVGDLTIKDTTLPVTFEATVTPVSDARLEGTATATILWRDFNLNIPDVPVVTGIDEDVTLTINFVAEAVQQVG